METGPSSTTFTSYLRKAYYITDSRYVVTIENDTLAVKKWFVYLCFGSPQTRRGGNGARERGNVDIFFHAEVLFGWNREE